MCEGIAKERRRLRRIPTSHVLFLDETAIRLSAAPNTTIVLPDESQYVIAQDTTAYALRYDMIACCTGKEVLPPIIYSPTERGDINVKGINTKMLIKYIQDILAQACDALDRYPLYLVLDRSTIHNEENILEAFHDHGCQDLKEIRKMPTQAAKRMSPQDSSLFHEWKDRVRKHAPLTKQNITQVMADEWNNLPIKHLATYDKHCGLTTLKDPYFDCPQPLTHQHKKPRNRM
jgi:hypothetical protein